MQHHYSPTVFRTEFNAQNQLIDPKLLDVSVTVGVLCTYKQQHTRCAHWLALDGACLFHISPSSVQAALYIQMCGAEGVCHPSRPIPCRCISAAG